MAVGVGMEFAGAVPQARTRAHCPVTRSGSRVTTNVACELPGGVWLWRWRTEQHVITGTVQYFSREGLTSECSGEEGFLALACWQARAGKAPEGHLMSAFGSRAPTCSLATRGTEPSVGLRHRSTAPIGPKYRYGIRPTTHAGHGEANFAGDLLEYHGVA